MTQGRLYYHFVVDGHIYSLKAFEDYNPWMKQWLTIAVVTVCSVSVSSVLYIALHRDRLPFEHTTCSDCGLDGRLITAGL